ncbi:GNAT family N-acetyltransferase [Kocuria sp. M1R5S2]|uniref:GNAT family N-acetyltransferase n=1 Tax=Kocuria rhizosphaerae TaxID=3376285 RepID=UPI003791DB81
MNHAHPAPAARIATPGGILTLEPLVPDGPSVELLHAWLTHPRSRFWDMLDADPARVRDAFVAVAADPHSDAWLARLDRVPLGVVETYDPGAVLLAGHYEHRAGDAGMHLLLAPARTPVPGTSGALMAAVLRWLFEERGARRVVVEPDVRNPAVHRLNERAGFRVHGPLELPGKTALLSTCTPERFAASELGHAARLLPGAGPDPDGPVPHLGLHPMRVAHRHLCCKAIAEFAHERLVRPEPVGDGAFELRTDGGRVRYRFRARRTALEHWLLDEGSLRRTVDGADAEPDAQALITELSPRLGIPPHLLGTYLEEIASTLASAAYKLVHRTRPSTALAAAEFQDVESAMTEGHPGFVANNGRIGLGATEHDRFAPEAARPVRLVWVAVRRELSRFDAVAGLDEEALHAGELHPAVRERFRDRLTALGLDPGDYRPMPVHPHQWEHRVTVTFAPDLARRDLVLLGEGEDEHRAQQSIRTFFNTSRPDRHYVKTALAVQNMGFLRGLSPRYMRDTPVVNDWVAGVVAADPVLTAAGFSVLREVAAVGYTGDAYHRAAESGHGEEGPHTKMLAALWRESPVPALAEGERLATLASLLHVDAGGTPLAAVHVRASGLSPEEWVRRLLDAYLVPVARCLTAHDLVFMPHGENLVLVLADHAPRRVIMKDIGEEVAVVTDRPLPEGLDRIRHVVPPATAALSVHTDVFDGVLRHLAGLLEADGLLDADRFWAIAARCLQNLADADPATAGRVPLFAPRFEHSCLNRLQLLNTLQMVDLSDQASSLQYAGTLENPVAAARSAPLPVP